MSSRKQQRPALDFESEELYSDVLPAPGGESDEQDGEPGEEIQGAFEVKAELSKTRQELYRLRRSVKAMQLPATEVLEFDEFHDKLDKLTDLVSERMLGEQKKWRRNAVEELITIVDAFDRLFDNLDEEEIGSSNYQGLKGIHDLLLQRLRQWGAEPISVSDKFDPQTQRALSREHHPDYPDQTVLEVTRRGYRFEGSVLRPAEVVVNRSEEPDESV